MTTFATAGARNQLIEALSESQKKVMLQHMIELEDTLVQKNKDQDARYFNENGNTLTILLINLYPDVVIVGDCYSRRAVIIDVVQSFVFRLKMELGMRDTPKANGDEKKDEATESGKDGTTITLEKSDTVSTVKLEELVQDDTSRVPTMVKEAETVVTESVSESKRAKEDEDEIESVNSNE